MSAVPDHIVPLSKGGQDTAVNQQLAHKRCNERKRDRLTKRGEQVRLIG